MTRFSMTEFNPVTAKEWKQKIQFDLKGTDYNETLVFQSQEGINVKPFYHQDDLGVDPTPIPGLPKDWKIGQSIFIDSEAIANKISLQAIEKGAEALFFNAEKEFDFQLLFSEIPLENVILYFNFSFLSETFIKQLSTYFSENKTQVFYNIDIIGNLARTGNWYHNLRKDHEIVTDICKLKNVENSISIDATLYQNAGANMVQQLAYSMAQANEYLNHFSEKHTSNLNFTFHLSVGTNYFFEIAKIRALRILFSTLAKEYGQKKACQITVIPTKRNKTIYDYNVNMLRTTTEYMSAILGGANTICSLAYDNLYHKSNEFGERIARNQILILKTESYFYAENNPAKGTYYIESLTQQLSEKALTLFKEIEKNGGLLKQLKDGLIQRKIKESAYKEQQAFKDGKTILLGINKYPNPIDSMKNDLELYPFSKTNVRKTLIEPILEKRIAEKLEQERLSNE